MPSKMHRELAKVPEWLRKWTNEPSSFFLGDDCMKTPLPLTEQFR